MSSVAVAEVAIELRPAARPGSYSRARALVAVEGKLKLNADGKEVKHLPIKVEAEVQYSERRLAQGQQRSHVRLARQYQTAQAKIQLHQSELTAELRPQRRLIVADATAAPAVLFSPQGPLTREELELIEFPASKLAADALLPEGTVKAGSEWTLREDTVIRLLGLEAVSQHEILGTVDSIEDNVVVLSLKGKVSGAVGGVSSDVELKGKLNFDLRQRAVTWLTLAYRESRDIGHAQPGFEVVTTLRMVLAPTPPVAELSDQALDGLGLKAEASATLIELTAEDAGFQLLHDRRWSVMLDRSDLVVLRLVDRGDLVAQCNITPLPPLGNDDELTLETFQEDVRRVLGKNAEQIVEASQEQAASGLAVLRVVVAGQAGDLPIQWTYYHLAGAEGRRASLVFTIESNLVERFAGVDRALIDSFQFVSPREPPPAPEQRSVRGTTPRVR